MKRIFTAAFIAATFMALAVSCQKKETGNSEIFEETPEVSIVLSDGEHSKAFFDDTSTAESFEKSLSSLSIIVFDQNSQLILRRNLTDAELLSKSCKFRLPKTVAGTNCTFYAVANYSVDDIKTLQQLYSTIENSAASYNGTFQEVTTAAKRNGGFVMSGSKSKEIIQGGTTNVSISIKRTVAKIAIQTSVSEDFGTMYGGKITVLSAKISNGAQGTRLIASEMENSEECSYEHTQEVGTSDGKFNSLFYLYENEFCENFEAPTITLNVLYDLDGDDTTLSDRREFTYEFDLVGKEDGIIARNGYYRVAATIKGPEGTDCNTTIEVSDWETPTTQEVDLGI